MTIFAGIREDNRGDKKERLKICAATVADMVSKIPDCARCNSSFEKERKKGRKRKHWQNEKEGEKDVTRI